MRWKKDWSLLIIFFFVLRCLYSALGVVSASGPDPEPLATGPIYETAETLLPADQISHLLVNVWLRWDTGWYLKIAAYGYDPSDGTTSFAPLYPWLVHGLAVITGNYLFSALLLSNIAALVVFLLLFKVAVAEGLSLEKARITVICLAFFPTSFFLFAAYSDSLFLSLALGAWISARRRQWMMAGLLGGLAALTRLQGALLTLVLLWLWLWLVSLIEKPFLNPLTQIRQVASLLTSRLGWHTILNAMRKPAWLGTILPVLTFAGYNLWLYAAGLGSVPATLQMHWGIRTVPPWIGVALFLQRLFTTPRVFIDFIDLSIFLFMLVILILGFRWLDPALSLYAWATLAFLFIRGTPPHLLDSFSRYLLAIFPAFLILGQFRHRALQIGFWVVSFGLQIFLLMGFLDWRWIA